MSPRRASLPPPLPPLRAFPDTSLAGARTVPGQTLAAPSRSRRGHKYNKQTIKNLQHLRHQRPYPPPCPRFAPSRTRPSLTLGPCPVRRSLPPPAPGGGINTISKPLKTFNTCATNVPTPPPAPASRLPGHVPR